MKNIYVLIALVLIGLQCLAQGEANNWYFGNNAGISFNGGTVTALTNGALNTGEGCAAISDPSGNLLFYTDGIRVWDRTHTQMPNGFGMTGNPSSAQSGIIVPRPGNKNQYYIFTVPETGSAPGVSYSVVDMTLNGGMGDVVAAGKNTLLLASPTCEKITAVKHANGLYVWVITHKMYTNEYYAYLVDCNGVNAGVVSAVGQVEGWPGWGCMVASPDGSRIATAMRAQGFEVVDFNNTTGAISNPILVGAAGGCYGISFSSNGNLVYGLRIENPWHGEITQWDLQAGNTAAIIASGTVIGTAPGTGSYGGGAMQLGPNKRIYITQCNQPFLSAINNPDIVGTGCNFQANAVDLLGRNSVLGLPPFIMSYFDTTAVIGYNGICLSRPTTFTIGGTTALLDSVLWNFDDPASGSSNTSNSLTPLHVFSDSGTFNVQLIRFMNCIRDTTYQPVTIYAPAHGTQSFTICPGSSFTLPDGVIVSNTGSYNSTILSSIGCDSIVTTNLTIANVSVSAGNDTAVCPQAPVQFNATGGLIYSWSPSAGLSNANIANPVATVNSNTTYVVSSQVVADNMLVNGDFTAGATGFTSSYNYAFPNTNEGQYWVGTNASSWNSGMASCGDHTTGTGNMLCVNGSVNANTSIYCQTISVAPNTDYAFSTWIMTLTPGNLAQLQFSINGNLLGNIFTAASSTCVWQQFYTVWNSGSSTTANICIVNQNTQASDNDFALDDMSFGVLCTATDTVSISVLSYNDTVEASICSSETYRLPDGASVFTPGTYVTPLVTAHGCDSVITTILTVTVPSINTSNDTAICLGSSAQLDANGGLHSYTWSPATGLSDPNIANPVATPLQTTQYILTSQVPSGELIFNGDFSAGNTGFSSTYNYTTNLNPEATYYVGGNPNTYHSGFSACPDHTTGSGNMMIVNGAGTPNRNIWCQTVDVVPNTDYSFSCWGQSVAAGSPAVLQFSINGGLLGSPFNVPSATCQWQQFYSIWNSGNATTANICIVNQNTNTGGNDFAIDDLSFVGLCNTLDTVTVTVNNPSLAVIDTAICQGLTYTFPQGNTSTTGVSDTAVFANMFGCDSVIITNLTINPSPLTDVYDTICQGETYTRPSGLTAVTTGTYIDTLNTVLGCDSIITTYLTVNPISDTTIVDTICSGTTYTLPDGNTVNTTGIYPVTLSNVYGCDSVVTTNLTVIQLTLIAPVTDVLCNGDSTGSIAAVATGGVSPYNYGLTLNGNIVSNNTNGSFGTLPAGNYTVSVGDDFGCTTTANALINEPALLVVNNNVTDVTCYGLGDGSIELSATGGTPAYAFSLAGANNASGNFNNLVAGDYGYTVTDAHNCMDTGTLTVTEPQDINLTLLPANATVKLGENLQLEANTTYGSSANYLWTPSYGLSCVTCPNPVATSYRSVDYHVQVSVDVNGNTCEAEGTIAVTVLPNYDLYIANSFTPNGDGVNDYFELLGNLQAVSFVEMTIFNRIGEKVFESNDINFKWDGTYKGELLHPGVLVYTLRVVFVDEHREELFTGSLTLLK